MDSNKLNRFADAMGWPITAVNGQRRFGPHESARGIRIEDGSEVFVARLPDDLFEDELFPLFSRVGVIYEIRILMSFTGKTRRIAFVKYTSRLAASEAVARLNGYAIRRGARIGVAISVDNRRLYVGGLDPGCSERRLLELVSGVAQGVQSVEVFRPHGKRHAPGSRFFAFAFVQFESHRAAAAARRDIIPHWAARVLGPDVGVDWALPEPAVAPGVMLQVKKLFVRNFPPETTESRLCNIFTEICHSQAVTRVRIMKNFAFVEFDRRINAERAIEVANNMLLDNYKLEVQWAKPIIKKQNSNKQVHSKDKYKNYGQEPAYSPESLHSSSSSTTCSLSPRQDPTFYFVDVLEFICRRFKWDAPIYIYSIINGDTNLYYGKVNLPAVGLPIYLNPTSVNDLPSSPLFITKTLAKDSAAKIALIFLKENGLDLERATDKYDSLYRFLNDGEKMLD